ncbi:MAG: 5'/3'-nucleotidase SurE [Alphaproteobacteria bacterium]
MTMYPLPDASTDLSQHRILVTNDDGIHSEGIQILEEAARRMSDDVWVVAPEFEQSGAGHSLTLSEPLRFRQFGDNHYAVRGTPTDCVVVAVSQVMTDKRPTLLLSGVNRGSNLGEDVTYSGTVAAAMEGTLLGIPSIAFSQVFAPPADGEMIIDWAAAREAVEPMTRWLMSFTWDADALMNVNFPDRRMGEIAGVDVTVQGRRDLSDILLEERTDTRGQPYYWIGYRRGLDEPKAETDLRAVRHRAISVTPLHLDLTHFETRRAMIESLEA